MIKSSSEGSPIKVEHPPEGLSYTRIKEPPYRYAQLEYQSHGQDGRWQVTRFLGPEGEWFVKKTKSEPRRDRAGTAYLCEWFQGEESG